MGGSRGSQPGNGDVTSSRDIPPPPETPPLADTMATTIGMSTPPLAPSLSDQRRPAGRLVVATIAAIACSAGVIVSLIAGQDQDRRKPESRPVEAAVKTRQSSAPPVSRGWSPGPLSPTPTVRTAPSARMPTPAARRTGPGSRRASGRPAGADRDRAQPVVERTRPRTTGSRSETPPKQSPSASKRRSVPNQTGGSGSGSLLQDRCDQLFPPSSPEFALRNRTCHAMVR